MNDDPMNQKNLIYGKEKCERYLFIVEVFSQAGSSWECRDCIVLDEDEYFEQLEKTYSTQENLVTYVCAPFGAYSKNTK